MPNDKKAYAQREKAYMQGKIFPQIKVCLLYTSPSPRDYGRSRMPSSA